MRRLEYAPVKTLYMYRQTSVTGTHSSLVSWFAARIVLMKYRREGNTIRDFSSPHPNRVSPRRFTQRHTSACNAYKFEFKTIRKTKFLWKTQFNIFYSRVLRTLKHSKPININISKTKRALCLITIHWKNRGRHLNEMNTVWFSTKT